MGRSAGKIVGQDVGLREVLARAARVAPTHVPVLVSGESGTGKELLARLVHDLGPNPSGPFVAINCGTLPRELADSELFGHERGAFTGAAMRKPGWFEEASGGTLVLDEIGELPIELQPKLLRVLETGRLRRVGGVGEVAVHVRVVAMTWRDLPREVERRAFRADLYHRLAGFELTLPPLRRRPGDIPALVTHFLAELAAEVGPRTIDPDAVARLVAYDWPGNVRQLRNVLWRAAILSAGAIRAEMLDLPPASYRVSSPCSAGLPAPDVRLADAPSRWSEAGAAAAVASPSAPDGRGGGAAGGTWPGRLGDGAGDALSLRDRTFDDIERAVLRWALRANGGSRRRAARALAIPRSTFCDKVRRYGLE